MLSFDELRTIIGRLDRGEKGLANEHLRVLMAVYRTTRIDFKGAEPHLVLDVVRNLLNATDGMTDVEFVADLLNDWDDQMKCPAKYEKAA